MTLDQSIRAEARDLLIKAGLSNDIGFTYDEMADEVIFVALSQRGERIMGCADFRDIGGRKINFAS